MILARDLNSEDNILVRRRKTSQERHRRAQNNTMLRQLSLLALGLIFFFVHLLFNWQTNQTAEELQSIQSKVIELQHATTDIEAGLTEGQDLRRVEYLATEKMGMVRPTNQQVIMLSQ